MKTPLRIALVFTIAVASFGHAYLAKAEETSKAEVQEFESYVMEGESEELCFHEDGHCVLVSSDLFANLQNTYRKAKNYEEMLRWFIANQKAMQNELEKAQKIAQQWKDETEKLKRSRNCL
jgi:hypothetical protein